LVGRQPNAPAAFTPGKIPVIIIIIIIIIVIAVAALFCFCEN